MSVSRRGWCLWFSTCLALWCLGLGLVSGWDRESAVQGAEPLPGTAPLGLSGDLSLEVVDRVDRWLLTETDRLQRELAKSGPRTPERRQQQRERLRRILGLNKDPRLAPRDFELVGTLQTPAEVAGNERVRVMAIR